MSDYIEDIKQSLVPLSEAESLKAAIEEWEFTGDVRDLKFDEGSHHCQLCGYKPLRWNYRIESQKRTAHLWVGSKCIEHFRATRAATRNEDTEAARKEARSDTRQARKSFRHQRVLEGLRRLWKKENADFQGTIMSIGEDWKTNGCLSPKQVKLLDWRLDKHDVALPREYFKVDLRKKTFKEQVKNMEKWKIAEIWPALSSDQRRRVQGRGWV